MLSHFMSFRVCTLVGGTSSDLFPIPCHPLCTARFGRSFVSFDPTQGFAARELLGYFAQYTVCFFPAPRRTLPFSLLVYIGVGKYSSM